MIFKKHHKVKFLILGAGPSGLSLAHALLSLGHNTSDIVLLEKEMVPGGLCRSEIIDNAPLDIGGGHFLEANNKKALNFLFKFMPEDEWQLFDRISKIQIHGMEIDHPLEANLWQLPRHLQIGYLESIAQAGCVVNKPHPHSFSEWVIWKFGVDIANQYLLPYNRKIFSMDLSQLGTYWLHKLPNVSFKDTLLSCLESRPTGQLSAHGRFFYPKKYGYGEVWRRMGGQLGDMLHLNCPIKTIDPVKRVVNNKWSASYIINTIPWTLWTSYCNMPLEIQKLIYQLKNVSINVDYVPQTLQNKSHWIYNPDESIAHHRLLLRSNFTNSGRGYWTETNSNRSHPTTGQRFTNEFAYPVNTLDKPKAIRGILEWASNHQIIGLGRWGKWEHMNSDVAVSEALDLASKLSGL
ncbi:amine oxidoreductase [Polynucleobacter tropicus]|uniref:Amine oxidoreductase n=1 Tax=Polynucleobacter tropicus TaxID=1743174 RepID=A0A6M9PMN6_9BURK|nr:NAD(P)-binding protein [Polynucleobacter tropicus]QKM64060.1 amine oxidoreductase [Polynucleobacter tropicus]